MLYEIALHSECSQVETDGMNWCFYLVVACRFAGCYTQLAPRSDVDVGEEDLSIHVERGHFENTKPIINMFLGTLGKKNDKSLEQLTAWLESKSCVIKAEIVCRSCIFTSPAQSHVRVHFQSRGRTIKMLMDISMEEQLRFLRYHQ